jgi:hypothetical protein
VLGSSHIFVRTVRFQFSHRFVGTGLVLLPFLFLSAENLVGYQFLKNSKSIGS